MDSVTDEDQGEDSDSEDEDDTLDAAGATYSEHLREVDVSGFLAHHHDMVVATAIEDVRSATQDELDEAQGVLGLRKDLAEVGAVARGAT